MGKFWVIALAGFLLTGCTGLSHRYAYVSAQSSAPGGVTAWRHGAAARTRGELYRSQSEWEEVRAREERRRWEADESYRRWFSSLSEEEKEQVRQRERELDAMLEAIAGHAS